MRPSVGAGWSIHHLTDRVVELRKDDWAYRRLTGRDGYVRVRVDPTMTREQALAEAVKMATKNDEQIAVLAAAKLMPSAAKLAHYRAQQARLARPFATPEDERQIGRKRV